MGKKRRDSEKGGSEKKRKKKKSSSGGGAVALSPRSDADAADTPAGAFSRMAVDARFALLPHCLDDVRAHVASSAAAL